MLTREAILAGPKPEVVEVQVPAFGGTVKVRGLTVGERDQIENDNVRLAGRDWRARIVVAAAVDDAGKPLFKPEDVPALSALKAYVLEPIVDEVIRQNRWTAAEVEALAKN
jgi:hypothetical protein